MISFIIPYYNVPTEMLRECVESILALSLSPEEREIIIVDDGSERSPLELLRPLLDEGIYLAPSQFETIFFSGAHTDDDIARTIAAAEKGFAAVKKSRG